MAGRHVDDTVADLPRAAVDGTTGQVDLGADPYDDDLDAELAARRPRRLTSRTTLALGGAVLVVGGFLGGVLVQKNYGDTTSSRTPAGLAQGPNRGFGGGGLPGGFGAGQGADGQGTSGQSTGGQGTGGATTGTVKLVDATTIYLTTADGETVTVKTSGATAVSIASAAKLQDLLVGSTVTIVGTTGADGIIIATQVTGQK